MMLIQTKCFFFAEALLGSMQRKRFHAKIRVNELFGLANPYLF